MIPLSANSQGSARPVSPHSRGKSATLSILDASDWIAIAALATAAVGTLAGLMLHGFLNTNRRIDDTSWQLAEIRADLSASEQRTDRRVERLENLHLQVPDRETIRQ